MESFLRNLAKLKIRKEKPFVVGITGSVGKSTAKELIYWVLKEKFSVRRSPGNYNNEIGLPLAILNFNELQGKNIFGWLFMLLSALGRIIYERNYPKILVLEMASDKPGDIKYLTDIVRPDIAVMTNIGPAHLEAFGTLAKIFAEKRILVDRLKKAGFAVLNFDDEYLARLGLETKNSVISYSLEQEADISAEEIKVGRRGLSFYLKAEGSLVPVNLKNGAEHLVYSALSATAVGIALKMNLIEISRGLSKYLPLKGRTKIFQGIKGSTLIDDSYNSNPVSLKAAINFVSALKESGEYERMVFVLGDMLELGEDSKKYHLEAGTLAGRAADVLITVGAGAKDFARTAKKERTEIEIRSFENAEEATQEVTRILKPHDLVLVKASQGIRLEKVLEKLLANKQDIKKLPRQEKIWKA